MIRLDTQGEMEWLTGERRGVTGNSDNVIFPHSQMLQLLVFHYSALKNNSKESTNSASIQIILFWDAYDRDVVITGLASGGELTAEAFDDKYSCFTAVSDCHTCYRSTSSLLQH